MVRLSTEPIRRVADNPHGYLCKFVNDPSEAITQMTAAFYRMHRHHWVIMAGSLVYLMAVHLFVIDSAFTSKPLYASARSDHKTLLARPRAFILAAYHAD